MKNEKVKALEINTGLHLLKEFFSGDVVQLEDSTILKIHPTIGQGQIVFYNLQDGLEVYDINIKLKEYQEIPLGAITKSTLQFLYCLAGTYSYCFNSGDLPILIDKFQTSVAHCDKNIYNVIAVPKEEQLILNMILVDKDAYFKKFNEEPFEFGERLKDIFVTIGQKNKYFHAGGFNLKIAEELKLVMGLEHANHISDKLSQKGRYYIILAKQIEQFYQELNNTANQSKLLNSELQKISELGQFIKNTPERSHNIKSLCLKSNLSPAKLQEGFKYIYENTVADYVREVRLDRAVFLLKTTELTISEIVYSVGLTSRSYFCKIFKKKYKCSPKDFRRKLQVR